MSPSRVSRLQNPVQNPAESPEAAGVWAVAEPAATHVATQTAKDRPAIARHRTARVDSRRQMPDVFWACLFATARASPEIRSSVLIIGGLLAGGCSVR